MEIYWTETKTKPPCDHTVVLVTFIDNTGQRDVLRAYHSGGVFYIYELRVSAGADRVVAWMPQPKPFDTDMYITKR